MTVLQIEDVREALLNIMREFGVHDTLETIADILEKDEEFYEPIVSVVDEGTETEADIFYAACADIAFGRMGYFRR